MSAPVTTTFWTVDTIPPQIVSVDFPAGTSFVSGDDVPVVVTATDEWGVASTSLAILDWSWSDQEEPWELTGVAPAVSAAGDVTASIDMTDVHGNVTTVDRLITITPNPNALAPSFASTCGRDGDVVVPGIDAEFAFTVTDDEAVENLRFFVDGELLDEVPHLNAESTVGDFLWKPPADAVAGTSYLVRFEARDFAGNVGSKELTVSVPTGEIRVGGGSLFNDYAGQELTLAGGDFILREPLDVAALHVVRGTSLDLLDGLTEMDLDVDGLVTVQCGAAIDASAHGYPGGTLDDKVGGAPAGLTGSSVDAGGSHGGVGVTWNNPGPAGEVFGSVYQPTELGGGGSFSGTNPAGVGAAGGGVLVLDAGTVRVDGEIRARGEKAASCDPNSGSGAGGSLVVRAGSLEGSGLLDASGGTSYRSGSNCWNGSGGGGRVALEVTTFNGFDPAMQARAWGGSHGDPSGQVFGYAAPGTVFYRDNGSTYGTLVIGVGTDDQGVPRTGPPTELPHLGTGPVVTFEAVGSDAWIETTDPFRPRWLGAWVALLDGAGRRLGTFAVAQIDGSGRALLSGAAAFGGAQSLAGEYRFDGVETADGSSLDATDPIQVTDWTFAGEVLVPPVLTTTNLLVESGATVHPVSGSTLSMTVTGTMTVESGAVIDLTGLGYGLQGAPAGIVGATSHVGGSHGGAGALGEGDALTPGEVYDSVYAPTEAGGGAGNSPGHPGGGAVSIDAGYLVLDGAIVVRGEGGTGNWDAAGAGGSVLIRADVMSGSGSIDASGGDAAVGNRYPAPGGGGGGRVAIEAGDLSGFDVASQVRAWGGSLVDGGVSSYATPGTVLSRDSSGTYGTLFIDAGQETDGTDRKGGVTELPALGSGGVAGFEVSGADAWVTSTLGALFPRWTGAWMELSDGSGGALGTFRVSALDASGRALLEGAGALTGVVSYRGEYRFDAFELRHGAGMKAAEAVQSGDLVLWDDTEVSGEISATEVTVKTGAVVRPESGSRLSFQVLGTMTVEPGALIDVRGLGYSGGIGSHVDGYAPTGVSDSPPDAGGSHGGVGGKGQYDPDYGGEVYDSVYRPSMAGGGGSLASTSNNRGGGGGGVVEITASDLTLDGTIDARGEQPDQGWEAGGAGGTVFIHVDSLSGSGAIDASGGDAQPGARSAAPGGGGGGRIALEVGQSLDFDPVTQLVSRGGLLVNSGANIGYGAPGTIFTSLPSSTYGDLRIDQGGSGGLTMPATVLPAVGHGSVGTTTPGTEDPTDLWIEPQDPTELFSVGVVGMWVRIGGVDYPVIDQSVDRRQLLLEGAAGSVATGDAYLGIYKFDSVTVTGDANLSLFDGDEVGTWTVDPGSTVTPVDLDPPTVTVTSPAAGTEFVAGDQVAISADVTDPSGVEYVTFSLGDQTFTTSTPPYQWTAPAPIVEVEQDVPIVIETTDGNDNPLTLQHLIHVQPVAPGDPPVVSIACPSPGARLAPGTGLDFSVSATHDDGVERIEVLIDDDPTVVQTAFASTLSFHWDAPLDGVDGEVHTLHFRARSLGGVYGEVVYPVEVIAANVITANTTIADGDTSLDGSSVVVEAGTLTVEGSHTFRDLVVLNGADVTHPAAAVGEDQGVLLTLNRDLFVACGAAIDVSERGYPGSVSYREGAEPSFYVADDFDDGNLNGWQIVDEGDIDGPSIWTVTSGAARQRSNIHSDANPGKGTYALWPGPIPSGDYRFSLFMLASDDDGVGVMFRYVDADNYYRLVWDREASSRRLERVEYGVVTVLAEDFEPYDIWYWYLVEIVADGPRLSVSIDGTEIFSVVDSTHSTGTIALYAFANTDARFEDIQVTPLTAPSVFSGASHGGRGGEADGTHFVYDSVFDPHDAGSGGGSLSAAAGGGVVRITAAGNAVIDGDIRATGGRSASRRSSSAGGSIRLDAVSIVGLGSIDASGGDGLSRPASGGGGRIALYGATISDALVGRSLAAGGQGDDSGESGAAGTIFVKRDAQPFGDLIIDNGGLVSDQTTELLAAGPGTVDGVGPSSITDDQAEFIHDLTGLEIFFDGDRSALWPITGHAHRGRTLNLDTSGQALSASVGDSYEGLYRFDRVIVRGQAKVVTESAVESPTPEVESGASWTPEHRPGITITNPLDGQHFVAGTTMTISADVDDLFGIDSVELTFDGRRFDDSSAPYEWTFVAPAVAVSTSEEVLVQTVDRSGRSLQATVTLTIDPSTDATAPDLSRDRCPRSGDLVLPGEYVSVGASLTDETLLYRAALLVDGSAVEEVLRIDQPAAVAALGFTVPDSAPPGTQIAVQIEVLDYGLNVTTEAFVLEVAPATTLVGDQSLTASLDGTDVVLGPGTFTVDEPLSPASLSLLDGAKLVPAVGSSLEIEVTAGTHIQCGGAVDATGFGYEGGTSQHESGLAPSWVSASGRSEGGSHGGLGTGGEYQGTYDPGEVYDSVYSPSLGGGGGGRYTSSYRGGSGGGVVEITANDVVVDGEIKARGEDPKYYAGAGAGGSVVIDAATLTGSGAIDASGGDYYKAALGGWGPPGGGGRVALYVDDLAAFDAATQVSVQGGSRYSSTGSIEKTAGPGTVYLFDAGSTYGRLVVDGGQTELLETTALPALGAGSVVSMEVAGTDAWLTGDSLFRPRHLGSWIVLTDTDGAEVGAYRVVDVDGAGRALLSGASTASGAAEYRGEYRFDRIEARGGAVLSATDRLWSAEAVYAEVVRVPATLEADTVTIASGAQVEPAAGSSLHLDVSGTLTVQAGAVLDVTGYGYEGGNDVHESGLAPPAVGASGRSEGGSHGGLGKEGQYESSYEPGEVFDSVYSPALPGGGGGRYNTSHQGGSGGGVIDIEASSVVVDGEIRARGGDPTYYAGAGAGGTIVIDAQSLSGTGSIDASGGDYFKATLGGWGPPGGGGRVALYVNDLSQFDEASQVWVAGGHRYGSGGAVETTGSSGTLFVLRPTSTFGDLFVHLSLPLGNNVPNTTLPTIGTGTVGVIEVDTTDPSDLWIEPQDQATLFSLGTGGMSVRIGGSDYVVIDQTADRRRLLLDGAAGLVSVGDAYQGVYKFDTVTVRGGAVLEFLDTADVTTFDVDADSQVITPQ